MPDAIAIALRFTSEAGTFDLLYDGMTIEFGSRKDPRVTFTSESDSEGTILTSNADITREYSLRRHAGTRAQIEDFEEQQEGKKAQPDRRLRRKGGVQHPLGHATLEDRHRRARDAEDGDRGAEVPSVRDPEVAG